MPRWRDWGKKSLAAAATIAPGLLPADFAGAGGDGARLGAGAGEGTAAGRAGVGLGRGRGRLAGQPLAQQFGGQGVPQAQGQLFEVGEGGAPGRSGLAVEVEEEVLGGD